MRWSTKQWTFGPYSVVQLSAPHLEHRLRRTIQANLLLVAIRQPTRIATISYSLSPSLAWPGFRFANLPGNIIPRPITEGARDSSPVAIGLIISHPDGFIWPLAHQLTPTACSLHPPNHVDEIPNPIPLHYSVSSSLRSPLALLTSLVYNAPPHVSESLYGFCLRITSPISSVYFIIVVRIVSSLSSSSFIPLTGFSRCIMRSPFCTIL